MTKNPYLNALAAVIYIALVATFLYCGQLYLGPVHSIILPITMLSILVLSATVMGIIFFYQPVQMYLDGHKKEALSLFLRTVAIFAATTLALMIAIFVISPR